MTPTGCATAIDWLLHWEAVAPDRVYCTQPISDGMVVDYRWGVVASQVRRMAAHLRSLDLPPRSAVALLGKNSAHWILADLAIWMAGHVSVPLYPTVSAETAAYVLEHSEARALFVGKMDERWPVVAAGVPDALPKITLPLAPPLGVRSWEGIVAATPPLAAVTPRDPGELATIVYTSGSTGVPKGVMVSFGAMMATAEGLGTLFPMGVDDRMLSYLPLAHTAERAMVEMLSLRHGFRVFFASAPATFMDDLRRARPTLFFSVPRLWMKFRAAIDVKVSPRRQALLFRIPRVADVMKRRILAELGLQDVRAAVTGSAPIPPEVVAWYRRLGLELLEGYALSENFGYSHGNRPRAVRVGTVGVPNPGVQCRLDRDGEVLVKSPTAMLGYFKDPARTRACTTADGFLRTGDVGAIDADGYLTISGRVKDIFKTSKGKYVAPVPIEHRLGAHPEIEAVCVAGAGQPQPFALVTLQPPPPSNARAAARPTLASDLSALLHEVNASLEDHEKLGYLVVVSEPWTMDNGLLTPTMKIKRHLIEARYLPRAAAWSAMATEVIWS